MAVRFVVLLLEGALVELLQAEGADKVLRVELLGHGGDAAARDGLLAAGTERAAALVVVHLAVRLAVVLEEAPVHKRGEALLSTQSQPGVIVTVVFRDRTELTGNRGTHPADKTLGMPQAAQRRDVVLQDGSGTAAAFWSEHVKVVLPAVRLSVLFVEALTGRRDERTQSANRRLFCCAEVRDPYPRAQRRSRTARRRSAPGATSDPAPSPLSEHTRQHSL